MPRATTLRAYEVMGNPIPPVRPYEREPREMCADTATFELRRGDTTRVQGL
jgi:hypothetical protein